jgi:glycosyltransferase involved in cell wall biosynthesis
VRRIVLISPSLVRDGGVAAHVLASSRALQRAGALVTVISESEVELEGIETVRIEGVGASRPDAAAVANVAEVVAGARAQVVHLHDVMPEPFAPALQVHAPVVASAHAYVACTPGTYYFSPGHECSRAHGVGCLLHMALRGCAHRWDPRPIPRMYRETTRRRRGLALLDGVISYSSAIERHLRNNGLRRLCRVRLFSDVPTSVTPLPRAPRVLFVGRVVPAKGLGVLLEAMAQLDARLEIHGDGWWIDEARRAVTRLGIDEKVDFRGWSTPEALQRAYRDARVVCVPSLWPEPLGLVGLEALSSSRPVVGSATGGIVDWLLDGVTGFAVPAGDAGALADGLRSVLADDTLAARMGQEGRKLILERFHEEGHVDDLLAAYRAAASWAAVRDDEHAA